MRVSILHTALIATGVSAVLAATGASAQSVPVPVRPEGFVFAAPDALSVLDTAAVNQPVAPASRPDLQRPAVPVAQVMNGGGFGYTGFDYFHDQYSEGRLGDRRRPRDYVVAPAYVTPPRR
ncbi:hypothetical protein [Methylobacterium aerolatum]|uniref:BA14K family protein n=1 Tax=Methylobacterium aerolatum TaxID=418708 RepID=A0ABU0HV71_9HYPH|nr:hypothetical protein [Methylobacterium aerolatum]MDQ0446191.1 hypothetical protein [Methylobacterium aerolatum]GJD35533.1 hypothetical protein FMGBMHLM_2444 [Methylobacterium aerolatum]